MVSLQDIMMNFENNNNNNNHNYQILHIPITVNDTCWPNPDLDLFSAQ
jgi:hypothetical protein